jgi:hypothetical protein
MVLLSRLWVVMGFVGKRGGDQDVVMYTSTREFRLAQISLGQPLVTNIHIFCALAIQRYCYSRTTRVYL